MNFFIDTNVFINWILIESLKRKKDVKEAIPFYKKIVSSHIFLEKLNDKNNFYTSPICLAEIPQAIIRFAVKRKMYVENIPFNYFEKYRKNFSKKEKNVVYEHTDLLFKNFIDNKKIKILHVKSFYKNEFSFLDYLQVEVGLSQLDSLILLDSVLLKEVFFVTTDRDFFDNKKVLERKIKGLKIITPETAIRLLK